eukprot:TRINITY_DN30813_c0_g2_i1.p2 TRINITY_DN30813_c0_g2~~TRINITY_DN30813_c0_g2_i1.p2  ORF type:complete len:119 (+),score=8.44 TRINITY_DN30813_c0_g2_i1:49-357(+)
MYVQLTSNMKIEYHGRTINYIAGVPQGALLSPIMFNLAYEILLREAVNKGWFIAAYADDLCIGLDNELQYFDMVKWLKTWYTKTGLSINKSKTKEFRLGKIG